MKTDLIRIGNSRGIRIPKPLIEQCNLGSTVELRVEQDRLIISPERSPRQGWDKAFRAASHAANGDDNADELLLEIAEPNGACPKVGKAAALTVSEAVGILRSWRRSRPRTSQLDGGSGNNPAHWIHMKVDGYTDNDKFTSRYGPTFLGQDYNGIVNFHGDTTALAIDRFIKLVDLAVDYRDVLRPSATYETKSKPKNSLINVRPKFALQDYQIQIEGFFLYHDGWIEAAGSTSIAG